MPDDEQVLGYCPSCNERVTAPWVPVRYEKMMERRECGLSVQAAKKLLRRSSLR